MKEEKELTNLEKILRKPKPLGYNPEAHRAYIAEIVATGDKKAPYIVVDYIQQELGNVLEGMDSPTYCACPYEEPIVDHSLHLYVSKGKLVMDCKDGCSRGAMLDKLRKDGLHHSSLFDDVPCTPEEVAQAWKNHDDLE